MLGRRGDFDFCIAFGIRQWLAMASDARGAGDWQDSSRKHDEVGGVLRHQWRATMEKGTCRCASPGSAVLPTGCGIAASLSGRSARKFSGNEPGLV